jgi:hypothetical protein
MIEDLADVWRRLTDPFAMAPSISLSSPRLAVIDDLIGARQIRQIDCSWMTATIAHNRQARGASGGAYIPIEFRS